MKALFKGKITLVCDGIHYNPGEEYDIPEAICKRYHMLIDVIECEVGCKGCDICKSEAELKAIELEKLITIKKSQETDKKPKSRKKK